MFPISKKKPAHCLPVASRGFLLPEEHIFEGLLRRRQDVGHRGGMNLWFDRTEQSISTVALVICRADSREDTLRSIYFGGVR